MAIEQMDYGMEDYSLRIRAWLDTRSAAFPKDKPTRKSLSELAGVGRTNLTRLLNGIGDPHLSTVQKILMACRQWDEAHGCVYQKIIF